MPIKDLKDEFVEAGEGQLHLANIGGCLLHPIEGPNGKREWQMLSFMGGHGPSNRKFVVNPHVIPRIKNEPYRPDRRWNDYVMVRTDPIPPMGDLTEAARAAARAVLEAMK